MSEAARRLEALLALMARLRDPQHGCPWDRAQDFASIAPHTIEEAYEVAEAIEQHDAAKLQEELGDLLFQVVFHARLSEERGGFDFAAVAGGIHDKLVRRHPHVFAGMAATDQNQLTQQWERNKAAERVAAGQPGTLDGVANALPALTRAAKLGRRAAGVGFDWPDVEGVRAKVSEELRELDAALATGDNHAVSEELGDLLFTLVNLGRHLQLDAEHALRSANRKFEQRFARMESMAGSESRGLESLTAADWEALWSRAKA